MLSTFINNTYSNSEAKLHIPKPTMFTPKYLYYLKSNDGTVVPGAPHHSTPTSTPSRETLLALDTIHEATIPLLGFAHPKRDPVPESIRAIWTRSENSPRLRDLVATSAPITTPINQHPCFGPVERPRPVSPAMPTISPMQSSNEPMVFSLDEEEAVNPCPYTPPCCAVTCRHDSVSPATPVISPMQDAGDLEGFFLDTLIVSTTRDQEKTSNAVRVRDHEERRQALGRALVSARSRRSQRWRESMLEMLERRDMERVLRIMLLADRGEAEW